MNVQLITEVTDGLSEIRVYRTEEGFSIDSNSFDQFEFGEQIVVDLTPEQFAKFIVNCIKYIKP